MTLSLLGRYRIESELGTGRYCETFQAFDLVHRRSVALKLLRQDLFDKVFDWRSFLSEVQRASDLVHPHIAWIWETDEQDGRYFLVERFIGGETLKLSIAQNGPLPADQAIKSIEEIAQAIEFGQQHGWMHGAVNPRNILISHDLGAVLSDFGLMSAVRSRLGEPAPDILDAAYLPPEVLRGAPQTSSADIYALACCLLEAISGSNPYSAPTLTEILEKKTNPLKSPQLPLEAIPLQAHQVIERALNPDPSKRFKYALDFIDTFERNVRHGLTDSEGRAQYEEQLRIWRAAQEQERILAEEIIRLDAVEKARQEIHERARREAEQALQQSEQVKGTPITRDKPGADHLASTSHPETRKAVQVVLSIFLLAIIFAGAFWLRNRDPGPGIAETSATPAVQVTDSNEPVQTETAPVAISTIGPAVPPSPSPTIQPSPTPTRSPSPSISPTSSRTIPPPTSTQDRQDNSTLRD